MRALTTRRSGALFNIVEAPCFTTRLDILDHRAIPGESMGKIHFNA
jgi:hypothetical protein